MDVNEHMAPSSAQHYSGRNRVPNIQEFMSRLDAEKKERDAAIDADLKRSNKAGEAKPHENDVKSRKGMRKVRDPVTGKDVEIQDAHIDYEEAVDNPQVGQQNPSCSMEISCWRLFNGVLPS
jgi:hypothetical protein